MEGDTGARGHCSSCQGDRKQPGGAAPGQGGGHLPGGQGEGEREMLVVVAGRGLTQDTRHTRTVVTDGPVPETPGRSPLRTQRATTSKTEYKNLVREIESWEPLLPASPASRSLSRPGLGGWAGSRSGKPEAGGPEALLLPGPERTPRSPRRRLTWRGAAHRQGRRCPGTSGSQAPPGPEPTCVCVCACVQAGGRDEVRACVHLRYLTKPRLPGGGG